MTILEFFAVLNGVVYLGFISFHKRMGWIFGCLSSALYVLICWQQSLFIQSGLQFLYIVLGIIGYVNWNKQHEISIYRMSLKMHLTLLILGLILSLFLGKLMSMTSQDLPFLDTTISVFSIVATILATRSILENWYYWIFVNLFSIFLFAFQGLQITAFLYAVYLFGSIFGLYNWKKMIQSNTQVLDQ
ncbi:MAG: nicotinamide mononucleotide transporter [Bacteroidetes bacterium]|nr:nicotinamide mononucleotide transporter [Bacteroidota bacterium]